MKLSLGDLLILTGHSAYREYKDTSNVVNRVRVNADTWLRLWTKPMLGAPLK